MLLSSGSFSKPLKWPQVDLRAKAESRTQSRVPHQGLKHNHLSHYLLPL